MEITVGQRDIRFDYSGTDAQTNAFVNGTYTSSASATILTFLQMVSPDKPVFLGENLLERQQNEVPPLPSSQVEGIPETLDQIIMKAVAKKAGDRFQTAKELATHLRRVEKG